MASAWHDDVISEAMADTVRLHVLNTQADDLLQQARATGDNAQRDELVRDALAARCRMLEITQGIH